MTKDEALKLAEEALELSHPRFGIGTAMYIKAFAAIKEALAQPEQEPVAWLRTSGTGSPVVTEELLIAKPELRCEFNLPLYTTPPQRKPLTDEELFKIWVSVPAEQDSRFAFARAIEAAHGIKGEA